MIDYVLLQRNIYLKRFLCNVRCKKIVGFAVVADFSVADAEVFYD